MLPSSQSVDVADVMVSSELPHRFPALAMIDTVPALRVVIITPPVVGSVSSLTMLGSDALQVMAIWLASRPFTTAGTWKVCTPSYAEYIGENKMVSALFGHSVSASPLAPPALTAELLLPPSLLVLLVSLVLRLPPPSLLLPALLAPALPFDVAELEPPHAPASSAVPKAKTHPSESTFLRIAMPRSV